ncbi:MAG: serine/threonine-protein kinase [Polyangia bacterium]
MTTTLHLPPVIASRYVPVRLIAKGGMGAVYEVEHARTGEHLALKVLLSRVGSSPEAVERFKREARAPARIKSEHVVRVTDADVAAELEGAPFLVMELLDGADLEQQAATSPPAPAEVVDWLRQVARTLDKAHGLGIVHRDLKPENLFLAKAENRASIVKILDFGIVKMTEEGTAGTGSGEILGTPKYMSPEQASAKGRITSAADRFSLGLVAYRLLTGHSYYSGGVLNILAELLHTPIEPPSRRHPGRELGAAFDAWFLKACNRDPKARFASASEQIESLSAALGLPGVAMPPAPEPTPEEASRPGRRAIVTTILVTAGLAVLLLAAAMFTKRPGAVGSRAIAPAVVPAETPKVPAIPPATAPPPAVPGANTADVLAPSVPAARPRPRRPRPPPADSPAPGPGTQKPTTADPYADQY